MLDELDEHLSMLSESFARRLNRRKAFTNTAKGLFATAAGITLAQLTNITKAFAVSCTCTGNLCTCGGTAGNQCPSGCTTCTKSSGCSYCPHSSGSWVSCTGLGNCGAGYKVCIDCKCGSGSCSQSTFCTCLSSCICCSCCNKQDVEAEMRRLAASLSAA